jgi:hypothetical protein
MDRYSKYAWGRPVTSLTRFSRLHFIMNRHRKNIDVHVELPALSWTITHYYKGFTYLQNFTPRIIAGSLYLRTQHWLLLPPDRLPGLPTSRYFLTVCRHLRSRWGESPPGFLSSTLQDRLLEFESCGEEHNILPGRHRCTKCLTEFQVDATTLANQGTGLVVTVWQEFGDMSTTLDAKWLNHTNLYPPTPFVAPGVIKERFGDKDFNYKAHRTRMSMENFTIKPYKIVWIHC